MKTMLVRLVKKKNTLNMNIVLYYILGAKIVKRGLNFYKNE